MADTPSVRETLLGDAQAARGLAQAAQDRAERLRAHLTSEHPDIGRPPPTSAATRSARPENERG
jgi:hypothetical protein